MLLFWKLDDETQMGNPRDHAARDILSKFTIFFPSRAFSKKPYHYETPCTIDCPKEDAANFESDTFLWFAYVVNMSKIETFLDRFWIFG